MNLRQGTPAASASSALHRSAFTAFCSGPGFRGLTRWSSPVPGRNESPVIGIRRLTTTTLAPTLYRPDQGHRWLRPEIESAPGAGTYIELTVPAAGVVRSTYGQHPA